MKYSLLVLAFFLLFGYEGEAVITLLDFMGYIVLFVALRQLRANNYFKYGMYFAFGNVVLWLITFYLSFLFNENTSQAVLDTAALIYVWGSYFVFMLSIFFTMIGIQSEASKLKLRWLEWMSIIALIAFLVETLIINAAIFVLQWEVLLPTQFIIMLINGLLIVTTIFARFNLQKKVA